MLMYSYKNAYSSISRIIQIHRVCMPRELNTDKNVTTYIKSSQLLPSTTRGQSKPLIATQSPCKSWITYHVPHRAVSRTFNSPPVPPPENAAIPSLEQYLALSFVQVTGPPVRKSSRLPEATKLFQKSQVPSA